VPNWELIIVDDGSTDSSHGIIKRYTEKDTRLRFFQHPYGANRGLPATLRLGLDNVRGRYVAFLESDDAWRSNCLEKRLLRLRESGADAVFNHIELVGDKAGKTGDLPLVEGVRERFRRYPANFYLGDKLFFVNVIPTFSCIMLKAEALAEAALIPPVSRWLDWWLWLQVAATGRFTYLDEPCTFWRRHGMSYNRKRDVRGYFNDSKAMWRAMRQAVPKWNDGRLQGLRSLPALPFYVYLLLRLGHMAGMNGPMGLTRRILSKFGFA
jgi:glycosyltransferase involved in cell wall biosynthesis